MKFRWFLGMLFLFLYSTGYSQEIREWMDLQIHPTIHDPYPFFGKGLQFFEENKPPRQNYKHRFRKVNYANYWKQNPGIRIFVVGALNKEGIRSPQKAKAGILRQFAYIRSFVEQHPDDFVIATSPDSVRYYVHQTRKTIILFSIEGGAQLIHSQEDANFWAKQGVAFITLIHLKTLSMAEQLYCQCLLPNS